MLVVESTGEDPYLSTRTVPDTEGPFVVRIRMRLRTRGNGQCFWGRPFQAARSAAFDLRHDGEWHEYVVPLPAKGQLQAFRLDPGRGAGRIEIDWIRLVSLDGKVLMSYDFGGGGT